MDTSAPRRSRASMRFSALEPASLLFASQQFAHKPLPPIPQDGPGTPSDEDEDGGRLGALEKLEGRRSVAPQKRDPTPSWLLDDATKKRGAIPSWIADSAPKSTDDTLHTLVEEDEENESRRADTGASNLQRPTLRPLRLTSMNAQGTPVVGLPRTKTARRASGLAYYPDTPPHERACAATHKPASSRSAQSTNTSWPYTDPAGSLFSPDSTASCSPGATSIDSVDHTPRLKRPAEPQAERRALPDVELLAQRERHTQEVTALQRELEEVRHVTGSQLASVSAARDAAVARAEALAAEVREKDEQLLDTSGERDMYRDDISDWRSRCSALEQTIQSQQLRLKQECTWRQVATKRMQAMSRRLQSDAPTGYASDSSLSSTVSLDALEPMPDLPEMPSDDELGDWSQQVARQLSKHAAADPSSDPPLETVHLLQDMREQIMTLYAQLQLEQSNHRLTRAQLDERVAEAQAAARRGASVHYAAADDARRDRHASGSVDEGRAPPHQHCARRAWPGLCCAVHEHRGQTSLALCARRCAAGAVNRGHIERCNDGEHVAAQAVAPASGVCAGRAGTGAGRGVDAARRSLFDTAARRSVAVAPRPAVDAAAYGALDAATRALDLATAVPEARLAVGHARWPGPFVADVPGAWAARRECAEHVATFDAAVACADALIGEPRAVDGAAQGRYARLAAPIAA